MGTGHESHDLFTGLRAALQRAHERRSALEAPPPAYARPVSPELALVDPDGALGSVDESPRSDERLVPATVAAVARSDVALSVANGV